jgi:hypothetical protein
MPDRRAFLRRRHVSAATTDTKNFHVHGHAFRLTASAVPNDGSLLSVTISSCRTCSAGAPVPALGPRAALRSGRLALDDLRPAVAGNGTGRGSAGTGRVTAASHITFRSGRSVSLRCSQRRSPGTPTDGPGPETTAVATAATARTPLQITCPRRSPGAAAVTAKTPKFGLEITAAIRALTSTSAYYGL